MAKRQAIKLDENFNQVLEERATILDHEYATYASAPDDSGQPTMNRKEWDAWRADHLDAEREQEERRAEVLAGVAFIKEQRAAGKTDEEIVAMLTERAASEEVIETGHMEPTTGETSKAKVAKEKPFCLCGCGVRTGGGRFLPGHDAKLKGRLLASARAGDADAKAALTSHGWSHFLAKEVKPKPAPKPKRTKAPKHSEAEIANAINGLTEHTGKALVRLVETDEFHGTNTVRKALLTRKLIYMNDQGTHATEFGLAVANQLG